MCIGVSMPPLNQQTVQVSGKGGGGGDAHYDLSLLFYQALVFWGKNLSKIGPLGVLKFLLEKGNKPEKGGLM